MLTDKRARLLREHSPFSAPSLGDAVLMLAHELRSPLSIIRSETSVLARRFEHAEAAPGACVRIERQVSQLSALIDDLVRLARSGATEWASVKEPVDVRDLVAALTAGIRALADERQIVLHVDAGAAPLWVLGHTVRLTQALTNVLTNAIKYTQRSGRVDVVASQTTDEIQIRVRDTGRGIAPDLLEAVFEPFARATADDTEGFGIGLAVARRVIEAHGGTVTARSDGDGRGSEFVIRLVRAPRVTHEAC